MAPKTPWKPWHKVVQLRDDVKSGDLSLSVFAADLEEVKKGKGGRKVYVDPKEFFALTYPTTNLRDLAKDVAWRLAGKNAKAIRQLELTYGGGKTHTLIALFHLANDPEHLPDLSAVQEFKTHIGIPLPRARIAVLAFDQIDVEKGAEAADPDGNLRLLRQPWSILAWQIAGADGLVLLHPDNKPEERDSAPAENLLEALIRLPQAKGLATLILIDEVLMYAYEKVSLHPEWLGRLRNFFQYLTQAVVKVDRAAMVASLLATKTSMSDDLGKRITKEIAEIFAREKEEGVQPVLKEDVAEVLRRRFFTPASIEKKDAFREHVFAALQGIGDLDEGTRKDKKKAEARFLASYPFHPDLTEVFYGKWTNMDGFQKTRGILRTFALGLRDSEKWDSSPLVGPNVFLSPPDKEGVSEAARELTGAAGREQTEGSGQQNWTAILGGELEKARAVQDEFPGLQHREIEQAVFATFIHSQPPGKQARLDELIVLVGATRPDRITLEKGLRQWFDRSWYLDESADAGPKPGAGQPKPLPVSWRMGSKPNLRQMHSDALLRVSPDAVEIRLIDEIRKLKSLTAGASSAGARVHLLPEKTSEVQDDGDFHYAILGPSAESESGKPSAEARRFLEENTGQENPRKKRNAVVLAVPSRDGLYGVRQAIRESLGWEEVRSALKGQDIDPTRQTLLAGHVEQSLRKIPGAVAQAYCIVATVSEENDVQAFKVQVADRPLFASIQEDKRSRIQDGAVSPDALLPEGPYNLWHEGEDSRRVKDLVGAFASFPHLPKMLNRQAILDTISNGCRDGVFVARTTRADKSQRTIWRERLDAATLDDPTLEVVLPQKAALTELRPSLLNPQALKELWSQPELKVAHVRNFFNGSHTISVDRGGFQEPLHVPMAPPAVVDAAIVAAVREGILWLTNGPASLLSEDVPAGTVTDAGVVQAPPLAASPLEVLPDSLPNSWKGGATTALALSVALSQKRGKNMPWGVVRETVENALRSRVLERTPDSGPWPCDFAGAGAVRLQVISGAPPPPTPPGPQPRPNVRSGEVDLKHSEIQDLSEALGALLKARAGYDMTFHVRLDVHGKDAPPDSVIAALNAILKDVRSDWKVD